MRRIFLLMFAILLALPLISASHIELSCDYDAKPYFNPLKEINWVCHTNHSSNCVSYIKNGEGEIIDLQPEVEYIRAVGEVADYECDKTCVVSFKPDYLVIETNYTFGVMCENEAFERNVTPQYYFFENSIANRLAWSVDNIGHIILFLLILALLIVVIVFFIRKWVQAGLPFFTTSFRGLSGR